MDEIESVAGSLKIPDSAIPPEQLHRRTSLKQPSPSTCVSAPCNFVQHALARLTPAKMSGRIRYQHETCWRERCLSSPLICVMPRICMVWLEKQEMEHAELPAHQHLASQ